MNEYGVARANLASPDDQAPRRLVGQGKRRGLLERDLRRDREEVARRHQRLLRERAGKVLPQDPELHAEALLSRTAELADAVEEPGLDENAISGREPGHSFADLMDDSRSVGARDLRQRNVRDAVADEDV